MKSVDLESREDVPVSTPMKANHPFKRSMSTDFKSVDLEDVRSADGSEAGLAQKNCDAESASGRKKRKKTPSMADEVPSMSSWQESSAQYQMLIEMCEHEITLPKDLTTVKHALKQCIQEVVELVEVA